MNGYLIGNFLIYCFINAFTPGPGNILTLNTVTNYGVRRGMPMFLGICLGYTLVHLLCAVFVFGIGGLLPGILTVLKYLGVAYLLWLAYHIATGKPSEDDNVEKASFLKGLALQFVNVKMYFFSITGQTGYVTAISRSLPFMLAGAFIMGVFGWATTFTWMGAGALIRNFYTKHYRPINIILALTLLECVYSILFA